MQWFRSCPKLPMLFISAMLLLTVIGFTLYQFAISLAIGVFLINWWYWRNASERMQHGCVTPGLVLSVEPPRVAVAADLSTGGGEYPTVKVIEKELPSVSGHNFQEGLRVAAVAVFASGGKDLPHWISFRPVPVQCATSNVAEIERCISLLPDSAWDLLNDCVASLPEDPAPGIYPIGWTSDRLFA